MAFQEKKSDKLFIYQPSSWRSRNPILVPLLFPLCCVSVAEILYWIQDPDPSSGISDSVGCRSCGPFDSLFLWIGCDFCVGTRLGLHLNLCYTSKGRFQSLLLLANCNCSCFFYFAISFPMSLKLEMKNRKNRTALEITIIVEIYEVSLQVKTSLIQVENCIVSIKSSKNLHKLNG